MDVTDTFTYRERLLDGEIRLLTVYAGEFASPIRCDLRIERLDDIPEYEALSYAWGDPTMSQTICIREKQCAVTESVYQALQYLRPRDDSLRIWIDAVCINQDDLLEKGVQVQAMGRVYERAVSCRVWLGQPLPGLESALQVIVQLATARDLKLEQVLESGSSIRAIFTSPWVFRLWALQEAALSRQCILSYGHDVCDDERLLCDISRNLMVLIRDAESWTAIDPQYGHRGGLWEAMKHVESMSDARETLQSGDGLGRSFMYLLWQSTARLCVDPRDHVYALRGLYERMSGGAMIPTSADYSQSVVDVFVQATTQSLCQPKGLEDWITALSSPQRRKTVTGGDVWRTELPSWVPNWAGDSYGYYSAWLYTAGGSQLLEPLPSDFTSGGKCLTLLGCSIGLVETCYENSAAEITNMSEAEWDTFEQWALQRHSSAMPAPGELLDAFARTLVADVMMPVDVTAEKERWASDDARLACKPWRTWETAAKGLHAYSAQTSGAPGPMQSGRQYYDTFQFNLSIATTDRAFSVTSYGQFALSPLGTRAGDDIVVFPGVPMPLVLRRQSQEMTWVIIGPAYVHGFMDGEAMAGLERGEYEYEERDFAIV
ncbi:hypothetical protein LTR85_005957 [Meristemomyces frigidus]|nr:hypothetical protein LTR85_005957 [Meristemomyces frigidus]